MSGSQVHPAAAKTLPRWRAALLRVATTVLARLLGTADGPAVATMVRRELTLVLRSREWHRLLFMWTVACAGLLTVPLIYRLHSGSWLRPANVEWLILCGYAMQGGLFFCTALWTVRRLRRDLYCNRLDELMLTRCSPADIAMGEALASAIASLWLIAAALPVCLFLAALGGRGLAEALGLMLSLAPAAALGVWFGMGWGLAFTLRRSAAMVPLTKWWFLGPFMPIIIAWSALGCFSLSWALLSLVPGGLMALRFVFGICEWLCWQLVRHWNPLLTVGALGGLWNSFWLGDWIVLNLFTLFMMRKSMDAVQLSLAVLPDRDEKRRDEDSWIHHDVHHFMHYGDSDRRRPDYRDGANAIAAFDVALGHRVYFHPFFWCLAIMAHLFLFGWSMLVPGMGRFTGVAAVLIPATAALLLMSGGVAVSFGWERDQHRWPALAVLPMDDVRIALGKIKGVVRPTLWLGLTASLTSLLLGWRGAMPLESANWMAIHVLVFPVTLAFVSAVLSLTTPTLEEALYRWAVLGAIPTLATALPYPVGGESGLALPFTPPLLALLLVLNGPTAELVRASWISLGLEVFGIVGALLVLRCRLRRWTVGERD